MISHFFIDRPIFAGVISVVITLVGGLFVFSLPIAQYPEIAPPTVQVSCAYPGADAQVVAETVASPIEQQVTGVENMLYMSSQCTNDGGYSLTITFAVGTDLDMAQVLVQNRVNLALPSLPNEVKQTGVSVRKRSPSTLLVVNLVSPDNSRDQLFLSNFATIRLRDELARIPGVGDLALLGQLDYSMRIWLDPERLASLGLSSSDVLGSLREQNVQVAAGTLARPPVPEGQAFQFPLVTMGRLTDPQQFGEIVVGRGSEGQIIRLSDVVTDKRMVDGRELGGIQLGSRNEDTSCTLDGAPSVGLAVYQMPGSNALDTAKRVREALETLKITFPPGVDYRIVYDTTPFIAESIAEVFHALRDAIILVAIVVLLFLQSWRATLIPLIAVPVAIIGTFAVMAGLGYSLNNLSLFGLVLAIGIVVDDAIVVVEAVEHRLEHGDSPRDAARHAMTEVAGPIIAISLVLMCVFIPCLFITGITGEFFRQFAVTIAVSTFFSAVNSLTLSPALAALLLRTREQQTDLLSIVIRTVLGPVFKGFNRAFDATSSAYSRLVGGLLRVSVFVLLVYAGLLWLTWYGMTTVPSGFIPSQDKGYLLVDVRLPDAASLERTQEVMRRIDRLALGEASTDEAATTHDGHGGNSHRSGGIPGVGHTIAVSGQSFVLGAVGSNYGSMFVVLDEFHDRGTFETHAAVIAARLRKECLLQEQDAVVTVFGPPAVDGLGSAGGFKLIVRDVGSLGFASLQSGAEELANVGTQTPGIVGMASSFRANSPQYRIDVDRARCKAMGIELQELFLTLQLQLGGMYANDFNQFGRTWQVNLQADPEFRLRPEQIGRLRVRSRTGEMVPLSAVANVVETSGPASVLRYDGRNAAAINGIAAPGTSSGTVVDLVDQVAGDTLPLGLEHRWTELTLLQLQAGNTSTIVFGIAVILVFLVLAAQYESLRLPLAVVLVVPMCLLCSVAGLAAAGLEIDIFAQIGFVVLVGLASKNAILIVEFAKEKSAQGVPKREATIEACRLRLRPIMMTSFAFILGVVPLALASGAGAEMRRALGIAVFSGMLGVTFFGIFLTPVFYFLLAKKSTPTITPPEPVTKT